MARIVILGAGYGGLPVAQKLAAPGALHPDDTLQLIDRNPYHTLVPRLHEAAAAALPLPDVIVPLASVVDPHRIILTQADVLGFDPVNRKVETSAGMVPYDVLVIALGSVTNFFGIPGLEQHSLTLKDFGDAGAIRGHVEQMFRQAGREPDAERRKALLTFVIGGGGFTGVQMAGELADWAIQLAQQYRIRREEIRIIIIEMMPQLMPGFRQDLVNEAVHVLSSKHVDLLLATKVERVDAVPGKGKQITLRNSSSELTIATETFIWTGGVRAPALLAQSGLPAGPSGRIMVNEYLQVPHYPHIFVAGDAALIIDPQTRKPVPPSAQLALLQAGYVAHNVRAFLRQEALQPFHLSHKGVVVGLGRNHAVGMLGALPMAGYPAFLLKQATEARWLNIIGGPSLVLSRTLGPKAKLATSRLDM